jgi:hypothetical protein
MAKDERKEEARESRAVIDRIEDGGTAVILVGDDGKTQVDIPVSLLPEGAKDGDHLRIHISLDRASRSSADERIKKLQDELKAQSGTEDKKDFKL